ncbi:hypothetical protein KKG83_04985 [Candidatus Micrarchaeota archaeon]|nr:hypothetical protein [Candidatus Micrarchaeota archaeon]MBU2476799.1 hypothetical protein [Candidatus Micrarchaeota archaeon]
MDYKEKLKPAKLNVILLVIGFILADLIMGSQVTCLDAPCGINVYFEPVILLISAIVGLVFYIIGSFLKK